MVCYALPFLRSMDYPHNLSVEGGIKYHCSRWTNVTKRVSLKNFPWCWQLTSMLWVLLSMSRSTASVLVVGGQDCVEVGDLGKRYAYTALGHIHKAQEVADLERCAIREAR